MKQNLANHFPALPVNRSDSASPTNTEIFQKVDGFFNGIYRFTVTHGFLIAKNFLQIICIRYVKIPNNDSGRFYIHFLAS